jgi:hypothetical protein
MPATSSAVMCWYRVVMDICDHPMTSMTARVGTPRTSSIVAAVCLASCSQRGLRSNRELVGLPDTRRSEQRLPRALV